MTVQNPVTELYYVYGCVEASNACQGSVTSDSTGTCYWLCTVQGKQRLGRPESNGLLVCSSIHVHEGFIHHLAKAHYVECDESFRGDNGRAVTTSQSIIFVSMWLLLTVIVAAL